MLAAGVRHRGDEFGVHGADEAHDDAADGEREDRPQGPRPGEPFPGEDHPAEADHRAEADEQGVDGAERLDEAVAPVVRLCLLSAHGVSLIVCR